MSQRRPRRRRNPAPGPYAGRITCLRCDAVFESWDRRQNRLCERCRAAIAEQPSDELSYPIPKSRGRRRDAEEIS